MSFEPVVSDSDTPPVRGRTKAEESPSGDGKSTGSTRRGDTAFSAPGHSKAEDSLLGDGKPTESARSESTRPEFTRHDGGDFSAPGRAETDDALSGGRDSTSSPREDGFLVWRERWGIAREGVRAVAPTLIATGAWGLVTGVAMVKSGLTESMALAMSLSMYAGSAQLTSLPLIATGAPLWLIFAAGFVVNLRFLIFGAALHPFFRHLPWPRRLALGYFTTDMGFVLFIPRFGDAFARGTREQLWFFIGVIAPGWFVWQGSSIAGIYLGSLVPSAWSLDFAAVLALLAIVVPLATTRPMVASIAAAGVTAWIGQVFPLRLGLAAAVIVGVVAGMLAERYGRRRA